MHLPSLPPFEESYIHHCISTIPEPHTQWKSNHLLITGLRTPFVWVQHPSQVPDNTLTFDIHRYNNIQIQSKWIPIAGNQLFITPLSINDLTSITTHIKTNLSAITNEPWSIAFHYPTSFPSPIHIPSTNLTKILTFTTYQNKIFTTWQYTNTLCRKVDPPILLPI